MSADTSGFTGHPRNIQYTTKVARLLNQTESGIARVLADESENFLERQYGRLFLALDINFTGDAYDVSEVISDTLSREFYADLNRGVLESFEHALTVVNQTLADLAADGQNDWVGQLNAVVAVLHENEIHLSQVGNAQAYLVRGHNATHITEGLTAPGKQATAKTFVNVASGSLEVSDKLLVASKELFNHLSISDVRRHLYLHPPTRAIRKMADQLTPEAPLGRLATVVIELTTIDLISAEPVTHEPDEIILGAPRRHFETLQRFKPFRPDTPLAAGLETAKKYYEKQFKPRVARTSANVLQRVRQLWGGEDVASTAPRTAAGTPETTKTPGSKSRPAPRRSSANTVSILERSRTAASSLSKQARDRVRPHATRVGKQISGSRIAQHPAVKSAGQKIQPVTKRVAALPLAKYLTGSNRTIYRNLILVLALLLVVSLVMSVRASQQQQNERQVRERIQTAEAQLAKAEASFIFKDLEAARSQLGEAKAQADELAKEKVLKPETAALAASVLTSYDRINNVVAVPANAVADFAALAGGNHPSHLTITGGTIVTSADTGALYSYAQANQETKVANANPGIGGNIRSLGVTSNGLVLFLTDEPGVWQFDTNSNAITKTAVGAGGAWESGNSLDTVQQNAFVLDPGQNQIWRHTRTLTDFGKGEPYVQGEADLSGAVDLVTGPQVYVLKSNGSVNVLTGGTPQAFELKPPPAPQNSVSGAVSLAVNFGTENIYVADPGNQRILEFNGRGEYVRQFKQDTFGNLKDMVVDEKSGNLYALADGKLWQIALAQ